MSGPGAVRTPVQLHWRHLRPDLAPAAQAARAIWALGLRTPAVACSRLLPTVCAVHVPPEKRLRPRTVNARALRGTRLRPAQAPQRPGEVPQRVACHLCAHESQRAKRCRGARVPADAVVLRTQCTNRSAATRPAAAMSSTGRGSGPARPGWQQHSGWNGLGTVLTLRSARPTGHRLRALSNGWCGRARPRRCTAHAAAARQRLCSAVSEPPLSLRRKVPKSVGRRLHASSLCRAAGADAPRASTDQRGGPPAQQRVWRAPCFRAANPNDFSDFTEVLRPSRRLERPRHPRRAACALAAGLRPAGDGAAGGAA
jgi:hypothetical protein